MKGDFTRRTFRGRNHYRSVLLQQGRVQLDADWNEQVDIWSHLERLTTADAIGAHGGPLHDAGMAITDDTGGTPTGTDAADLRISAGRYYVDGILCENEDPVPLGDQPDLVDVDLPSAAGRYVAYLDVWCEHVTAVERPELREVALGGPDTATRGRVIWQVRLDDVAAAATCADVAPPWTPPGSASTGELRARAQAPTASPDPCVIPATAGYRRLENQLYRVEILDGSDASGGPTYLWSRDNGSVVARLVDLDNDVLTIDAPGRDELLGFAKDDWVEVTDVDRARRGEPGFLGRLGDVAGVELPVAQWRTTAPTGLGDVALVRRWDSAGAAPVDTGWADLEDGVQIEFAAGGVFRTGDYWLIPARTANLQSAQVDPDLAGDVEWPRDGTGTPVFQRRAGVAHRHAAIALLDRAGDGTWTLVSDCRRLFPPVTELTDVEYAGGDGQEAMPGDPLPQPLLISVSNGTAPVAGARVRFTAADADGRLAEAAADLAGSTVSEVESTTDADGIARCFWRPAADVTRPSQQVTARLLGSGGAELGAPVRFAASLSIADQVWYDPGTCTALGEVGTVQEALDRLAAAQSLAAVGGDGQDGQSGQDLPFPAEVLVRDDCGPVAGATVEFQVTSGAVDDGPVGGGANATVAITTGADGVARCFWRLGPTDPVQALTATLVANGAPVAQPTQVSFTANLRGERDVRPGLHVQDVIVRVGDEPLRNDSVTTPDALVEGIAVVLDGQPLEQMVRDKPVLTLSLDLPFPFNSADRELWGDQVIGATPVALAGAVQSADEAVVWSPTAEVQTFLRQRLFPMMTEFKRGDRVLCHLTLTGRAIADSRGSDRRMVNGLALGIPRDDGSTDLELPTVDDVLGADFTLWFWLVASIVDLTLLPHREGLLRLKTLRDALSLALPRDELRANLPVGIRVTSGDTDLDEARRLIERAFRDRPERRLVFVVERRLADAAKTIRDSLRRLEVELELITVADPVKAVQRQLAEGGQLDAVLVGGDAADAITALTGFGETLLL